MALRQLFATSLCVLASSAAFAGDQFFQVGKTYLFVPRVNMVMVGTVTQITDQEIVFIHRMVLKESRASSKVMDDVASGKVKSQAIINYLKSDQAKRELLVDQGLLKDIPISYSRAALTAIKVD